MWNNLVGTVTRYTSYTVTVDTRASAKPLWCWCRKSVVEHARIDGCTHGKWPIAGHTGRQQVHLAQDGGAGLGDATRRQTERWFSLVDDGSRRCRGGCVWTEHLDEGYFLGTGWLAS